MEERNLVPTKEDYIRFVEMLSNRQMIVVLRRLTPKSNTFEYKFICANDKGKWDYTWLVFWCLGCPTNGNHTRTGMAVRGHYCDSLLERTLDYIKGSSGSGAIIPVEVRRNVLEYVTMYDM